MSGKPTKKKAKPATTEAKDRLRHLAVHGSKNIMNFNPLTIEVIENHNPRNFHTPEMRKHLDELKLSIAASGVLSPVCILYDNADKRAFLIDGEIRLRACLELQAEGASDILIPGFQLTEPDVAKRTLHLLQANSGHLLNQLECGKGYKTLLNSKGSKWTVSDIAQKVGKTIRYVEEALELFDLPAAVKAMVEKKQVTLGRAIAEVRMHGAEAASILAPQVAEAEAAGSGPLRRSKKKPAISPFQLIAGKILAEVSPEFKRDENAQYFSVSANLIRQLAELAEAARPEAV